PLARAAQDAMTSAPLADPPVAGRATGDVGVRARASNKTPPVLHRALPTKYQDLMRNGVPRRDMVEGASDVIVFKALVSIAASACQRGWTFAEWSGEVLHPSSALCQQYRLRGGV